MSDDRYVCEVTENAARQVLGLFERAVKAAVDRALETFPDDAAWRAKVSETLRRLDPLGPPGDPVRLVVREDLLQHARAYVQAFETEFDAQPDLDRSADAEHATAALSQLSELRGVSWEDWSRAVHAVVWARQHQVRP